MIFLDIMVVQGYSMEQYLVPGQLLFVNRLSYGLVEPFNNSYIYRWRNPIKGEIVVFKSPLDGYITVKRCIAVAGDPMQIQGGYLFIENEKIPLKKYQEEKLQEHTKVPENSIFVLGDNVAQSIDSRELGFITLNLIIGQVMFVSNQKEN